MPSINVSSPLGEMEFTLSGERTTIGRHSSCSVCIPDLRISKTHAVIRRAGNEFIFEDTGSSNGTFYCGSRIRERILIDGDILTLGQSTLTFSQLSEKEMLSTIVNFSAIPNPGMIRDRMLVNAHFLPEDQVPNPKILRSDYEKLRLGNELLRDIGEERNLKTILDKVTEHLMRIFPADRCVVLLVPPGRNDQQVSAVRHASGQSGAITVSETVIRMVRESMEALLLSDTSLDDRFSQTSSLINQGIRSVMCAPIVHGGNFLGTVHLDNLRSHSAFTHKDLRLLTGIVSYVAMAVSLAYLMKRVESEAKTAAQFERLLSPALVRLVTSGKVKLERGGEMRNVTLLFADIRNFSRLSQNVPATRVVELLNRHFELMVDIIFKHGGTVDKFIGDAVMALFGAPIDLPAQTDQAVGCALAMQAAMEDLNAELAAEGEQPLQIGIGIDCGNVLVGSIGSSRTMQYTCIGDAVNIASRITDIAKPGQCLISSTAYANLKSEASARPLGPVQLKGIDGPVEILELYDSPLAG